jgi:hypothetical protein
VRRALAAAGVVLAALPALAAAAPPRSSFVLPEEVVGTPALLGDSLFYVVRTRRAETVKRLDLNTLQAIPVYTRAARSWSLGPVRSGGGRVAAELDDVNPRGGLATRVVELTPPAPARVIAGGLLRVRGQGSRTCGTEVTLEDVSPEDEPLVDQGRQACRSGAAERHVLRRYGAGLPAVIHRYVERRSDESPEWRLVAGRLLRVSESSVRIGGRRIRPSGRGYRLAWADLDAAADVVIGEIRVKGRSVHELVRLVTPVAGRLLLDLRDVQAEPRFCGNRLVVQSVSRQRQQLLVYDDLAGAPRVPLDLARTSSDLEIQLACDAESAVLVGRQAPRRTAIEVLPLAP